MPPLPPGYSAVVSPGSSSVLFEYEAPDGACDSFDEATEKARLSSITGVPATNILVTLLGCPATQRRLSSGTPTVSVEIVTHSRDAAAVSASVQGSGQITLVGPVRSVQRQVAAASTPTQAPAPTAAAPAALSDPCAGSHAQIVKDPHLSLASDGRADFRGKDGGYFNMLSAKGITVTVKIEEARYFLHNKRLLVNGTFITEGICGGARRGLKELQVGICELHCVGAERI